ncbi:hypothetical protein QBC42DRAFT_290356 [Cladorrhinum samala]|uniref:Protein kinase domain-containing protein n=1 Tax=Cladorrhinum samala TaxID=585594 RepID=A0AAV9HC37_9PEZI|nr:hypothetical protein QBC42DRAFT_290356 [Cladorrhinum samala]
MSNDNSTGKENEERRVGGEEEGGGGGGLQDNEHPGEGFCENLPTPATFTQLAILLNLEEFPIIPDDELHLENRVTRWLHRHRRGFYYMGNLHPNAPAYKSMLIQARGRPKKLYVKKCISSVEWDWKRPAREFDGWETRGSGYRKVRGYIPPELRISTLKDRMTQYELPLERYFPKLYAYEFLCAPGEPLHEADQVALYYKHYNGRSLRNLLEVHSHPNCRQPLDEAFIWWVLLEMSKAVVTLQTGLNGRQIIAFRTTYHMPPGMPFRYSPPPDVELGPPREYGEDVKLQRRVKEWPVIVHRNITLDNIYLHFPEEGDRPGTYPPAFPDVVLCNFSEANTTFDRRDRWKISRGLMAQAANQGKGEDEPFVGRRPRAAEDRYALGVVLRRLVSFLDGVKDTGTLDYDVDEYPMWKYCDIPEEDGRVPGLSCYYSKELLDALQQFEWRRLADTPEGAGADADKAEQHRRRHLEALFQKYPAGWPQLFPEKNIRQEQGVLSVRSLHILAQRSWVYIWEKYGFWSRPTWRDLHAVPGFGTTIQNIRAPLDFELVPWSPQSRSREAALAEIRIEMSHHLGRYRPTWLRWRPPLDVSRIPGEFRRMYGPPFQCRGRQPRCGHARRDRGESGGYDDCDCGCDQDCTCGCKPADGQRTPTPPPRLRIAEDTDSDQHSELFPCKRSWLDEPRGTPTSSVNLERLLDHAVPAGSSARLRIERFWMDTPEYQEAMAGIRPNERELASSPIAARANAAGEVLAGAIPAGPGRDENTGSVDEDTGSVDEDTGPVDEDTGPVDEDVDLFADLTVADLEFQDADDIHGSTPSAKERQSKMLIGRLLKGSREPLFRFPRLSPDYSGYNGPDTPFKKGMKEAEWDGEYGLEGRSAVGPGGIKAVLDRQKIQDINARGRSRSPTPFQISTWLQRQLAQQAARSPRPAEQTSSFAAGVVEATNDSVAVTASPAPSNKKARTPPPK